MMTSGKKNAATTAGADRGTIAGLFRTQVDAERAIRDLKDAGIAEGCIGVAMKDRYARREPAEDTPGAILGGVVGLLAGVGALAVPGVGPIIAGGTLASALAVAGVGPAAGAMMGVLTGMGISEDDARYFQKGLKEGGVLVSASAGSRGPEAREILRLSGADLGGAGRTLAWDAEDDLGGAQAGGRESWRGSERRYHDDSSYLGPERRFSAR
jgi:hypothetical protein